MSGVAPRGGSKAELTPGTKGLDGLIAYSAVYSARARGSTHSGDASHPT